jgi:hypothetical protein
VQCPLHGKRFTPRFHIYVAAWCWENEVKFRQELRREIVPGGFAEAGDKVFKRKVLGYAESRKTYRWHSVRTGDNTCVSRAVN